MGRLASVSGRQVLVDCGEREPLTLLLATQHYCFVDGIELVMAVTAVIDQWFHQHRIAHAL